MSAQLGAPAMRGVRTRQHRRGARGRALKMALATLAAPALAVLALAAFGAMGDEAEPGLGSLPAAEGLQGSKVAVEPTPRPRANPAPPFEKEAKRENALVSRDTDRSGKPAREPAVEAPKAPREAPDANGGTGAGFTPGQVPTEPQPATATPTDSPDVSTPSSGSSGNGSGNGND